MPTQTEAEQQSIGDSPLASQPLVAADPSILSGTSRRVNFGLMAAYQIILRTGWIFKTESIIMPAVLDTIGGPGWLRGCLPALNRFGQSVPPMLASAKINAASKKKLVLASSTLIMGLSFLALAALWWSGVRASSGQVPWWMPYAFLAIYAVFFISTGINQLTFGTLTGKLIAVDRRGRLMLFASAVGTASAVACALAVLPHWLKSGGGRFTAIFAVTGGLFVLAASVILLIREGVDRFDQPKLDFRGLVRSAALALVEDKNLRRIAMVSALFGMSLTLFPHYQALGRQRLGLGFDALIPWVIAQNIGVAVFSIPAGWLADRSGNRVVLRCLMSVVCIVPLIALAISHWGEQAGIGFTLVFFLIGATPVTIRTVTNYCLELASREEHSRYLSTLGLCTAGPAIFSAPLVGFLIDRLGFDYVFLMVELFMVVGWWLTLRIVEPRLTTG
ncbi:MAG: MFS transporter [Planctomycetota bacterium]